MRKNEKEYYQVHKETLKSEARARYQADPKRARDNFLKRVYGLSLAEYNNLFLKQSGCCDICGKHQTVFAQTLNVDHDHNTGKVRGLLCGRCNVFLGVIENNEWVTKMRAYLSKERTL